MNCGDCRKRSNPGGASRSMISPNVTVGLGISDLSSNGDGVDGKAGVHGGDSFERQQCRGRGTRLVEEFEANAADLLGNTVRERIEVGKGHVFDRAAALVE